MSEGQAINDRNIGLEKVDEPMHYPWAFVVGLEADGHIIPSLPDTDDIASNWVHKIIG